MTRTWASIVIVREGWLRYTREPPMGFVDLHSHVLYGVDDGAPDAATAVALRGLSSSSDSSPKKSPGPSSASRIACAWP
mgnify:CR=1 FL=1